MTNYINYKDEYKKEYKTLSKKNKKYMTNLKHFIFYNPVNKQAGYQALLEEIGNGDFEQDYIEKAKRIAEMLPSKNRKEKIFENMRYFSYTLTLSMLIITIVQYSMGYERLNFNISIGRFLSIAILPLIMKQKMKKFVKVACFLILYFIYLGIDNYKTTMSFSTVIYINIILIFLSIIAWKKA